LAARTIVAEHGGEIPRDPADVEALPGIGRYTAGAILSIAFDVRCPLVDANVARVLSRVFGLRGDPKSTANQSALWSLAERLVPVERAGDFNQALMELGALVCRPDDPLCERCPLLRECVAGNSPDPTALPEIPPGRATVSVVHSSAIILRQETQPPRPEPSRPEPKRHRGARIVAPRTPYPTLAHPRTEVLIVQRPPHGLWGGLWEFPRVVCAKGEDPAVAAARAAREVAGLEVTVGSRVGLVKHSVTHHRIALHGYLGRAIGPADAPPAEGSVQRWAPVEEVASYALSAPQVLLRDALERMLAEDAAGAAHPAMEL
jgi:A/G-specific adenine glycosylase